MSLLLKSAIALGAAPLLVGTLIYTTWRFTRWRWLEMAGIMTIPVGFAAFLAGTTALAVHLWCESRSEHPARRSLWLQGTLAGGLLLANVPAAAFYALSAVEISTRYTVRVHNDSDGPIESLVVTGPGVRVQFGPIPRGQHAVQHVDFRGDGTLEFSARQQDLQFGGNVDGYVTSGLPGDTTIHVKRKGVYEIRSADGRTR